MATRKVPFSLEAAQNGATVVTRDGREFNLLSYNPDADDEDSVIVGWADNELVTTSKEGKYFGSLDMEQDQDLFILEEYEEEAQGCCNGSAKKVLGVYGIRLDSEGDLAGASNIIPVFASNFAGAIAQLTEAGLSIRYVYAD